MILVSITIIKMFIVQVSHSRRSFPEPMRSNNCPKDLMSMATEVSMSLLDLESFFQFGRRVMNQLRGRVTLCRLKFLRSNMVAPQR